MSDAWLTWQGIRDLATCEAQAAGESVRYVQPQAGRSVRLVNGRPQTVCPPAVVTPGSIVYARDVWRAPWRTSLASITASSVLVTTFNDAHVQAHAADGLLDGTQIRRWFAVQCATRHPKLSAMPIGMDRRDVPTLLKTAPAERDITLLVNLQPRTEERRALIAQFAWATVTPWRAVVRPDGIGYGPACSQAAYYGQLARSRFVLSPAGRGWDCYRTYEAIALGAVPIVKRAPPLSDVVAGMPVVLVDDWSEVTPAFLAQQKVTGETTRLRLAYWAAQIQGA